MMTFFRDFFTEAASYISFVRLVLHTSFRKAPSREMIFDQIWKVTAQSSATTVFAGFFVGAIMAIQFTMQLSEFGALGYLGGLSTSGTIREVGPLLIAFMLSGKVGAFTSGELGTMKVTEQIDAIRCLGADPIREIIVPRFFGIIISSFFLLFMGLFASIFGGMMTGAFFAGVNPEEYLRHVPAIVTINSIFSGLFKCFVFALVLASVCTFKGYTTTGGAKGVGRAVVSTSVVTMVTIVVADWGTSAITRYLEAIFVGI